MLNFLKSKPTGSLTARLGRLEAAIPREPPPSRDLSRLTGDEQTSLHKFDHRRAIDGIDSFSDQDREAYTALRDKCSVMPADKMVALEKCAREFEAFSRRNDTDQPYTPEQQAYDAAVLAQPEPISTAPRGTTDLECCKRSFARMMAQRRQQRHQFNPRASSNVPDPSPSEDSNLE